MHSDHSLDSALTTLEKTLAGTDIFPALFYSYLSGRVPEEKQDHHMAVH